MSDYGINIGSRRSRNVITPTFSRDFVTNNTLNHGVGPNITFTRASSATVFTSTGILSTVPNDVPRFEYGDFRTNYRTFSQDFDQWSPNQLTVTANNTIDPFGTSTADRIIENTDLNTFHVVSRSITIPFAGPFTYSVFVKPNGRNSIYVELYNDPSVSGPFGLGTRYSYFNLTGNGSIFTTLGNITPSISALSNGWYRCSITSTALSSSNTLTVVGLASSNSSTFAGSYTGDGSSGVFLWGAQVETGLSATSYIPTTTTAVTTGVSRGLLIEESRTNFIPTNNVFNWFYNSSNVSVSAGTGIAGLSSYIVSDITDQVRESVLIDFLSPLLTATSYTFSGYIKKDLTANNLNPLIRIRDTNNNYFGTSFNEALGTSQISQSGPDSGLTFITNVSTTDLNTHFRHSFTFTAPTTARPYQFQIFGAHGDSPALSGSIEVAGLQIEQGTFPTSYIPTAGLSATRQADDARVSSINTGNFFNQEQGTLFMETQYPTLQRFTAGSSPGLWTLDTGAFAQGYGLVYSSLPTLVFYTRNLGNTITTVNTFPNTTPSITKIIATISPLGSKTLFFDGRFMGTNNTQYTFPPITTFRIGANNIAGSPSINFFDGYIRKITYWPTRLSNNRLRLITS
jgi:hypothetical protein